jgi:hypothetical protein
MTRPAAAALLLSLCLGTAACGDAGGGGPGPPRSIPDPHPCDLLGEAEVETVLGSAVAGIDRSAIGPGDEEGASCTWFGPGDGWALGLIVEGPGFLASGSGGYTGSEAGYLFWRDDALTAAFEVEDLEGVGDAAFIPLIGEGPHHTMVMRRGEHLVHVTLLTPGSDVRDRLLEAARMVAAALG